MSDECDQFCFCPIKGVIDVISKKWALFIVNALGNRGKLRFNDLMKELGGISPKTLSDTLKDLQTEELIRREPFAEIPPRVEYSLTQEGAELRKAIIPLLKWAATRNHAPNYRCSYRKISSHVVKTDAASKDDKRTPTD
jgi:DNA-binding HxlR family transcriptional regulator